MSFFKRLFSKKEEGHSKEEDNEIPGQAHGLRDGICAALSSHLVSVEDIAHKIEAGLQPASLNRTVRERLAFIARLIAFLTATDSKACQAAAKAIVEAMADANQTGPLPHARFRLTTTASEAVSNRRDLIAQKAEWGELVSLINRLEPLAREDGGLLHDLYFTCGCLETIALRHLDEAMERSGEALEDLRLKSRLTGPLTWSKALKDPAYVNSLKRDPRIKESKKVVKTALSYLHKSLETRGSRTLSGGRHLTWHSEYIDFLRSL